MEMTTILLSTIVGRDVVGLSQQQQQPLLLAPGLPLPCVSVCAIDIFYLAVIENDIDDAMS